MTDSGSSELDGFAFDTSKEDCFCIIDRIYNDRQCAITVYRQEYAPALWKVAMLFSDGITRFHEISFRILGSQETADLWLRVSKDRWNPDDQVLLQSGEQTFSFPDVLEIAKDICANFGTYNEKTRNSYHWVNRFLAELGVQVREK